MIHIGIPAHNEQDSIFRTLTHVSNSIVSEKIKVTICLSNCKDSTQNEVERFKKNSNLDIELISDKLGGKARALKKLDSIISSSNIIFLDADSSPSKESIQILHDSIQKSKYKIVSGDAIDPRYIDKANTPKNFIENFNHVFWQRSPRKIINGQFFATKKGTVQVLPDNVKLDDVFLSIYYWSDFEKDNEAKLIQGSPSTISDIIKYQKQIQSGKKQIKALLKDKVVNFNKKSKRLYSQFYIKFREKNKYYPNVSYISLLKIKLIVNWGKFLGIFAKPVWKQTKSSKIIDYSN